VDRRLRQARGVRRVIRNPTARALPANGRHAYPTAVAARPARRLRSGHPASYAQQAPQTGLDRCMLSQQRYSP
jgi:hypothetical protein